MKHRVAGTLAVGLAAGALALAACGTDDDALPATNAAPTDATPPVSTIVTPTSLAASPSTAPIEEAPDETTWVPPSITSPTIPYTLPPDYGQAPTVTRDVAAPPRATYAPGEVLPPVEFVVDEEVTVQFTPPSNFRQDPRPLSAIQDYDRANGVFVLERWLVSGDPVLATFAVQSNPGEESPLLSRQEFPDSIVTDDLTWYLWNGETVDQTGKTPNRAMAVTTDYLYMVSGTPDSMRSIIDGLVINR